MSPHFTVSRSDVWFDLTSLLLLPPSTGLITHQKNFNVPFILWCRSKNVRQTLDQIGGCGIYCMPCPIKGSDFDGIFRALRRLFCRQGAGEEILSCRKISARSPACCHPCQRQVSTASRCLGTKLDSFRILSKQINLLIKTTFT